MKYRITAATLVMLAVTGSFASQANDLNTIKSSASKINESAIQSQNKIDKIADTMQGRLQQFKSLNKEIDGLTVYNTQLSAQIKNQITEMANLNEAMDSVSIIERQITPLMLKMITSLEQFVALDIPFLPKERSKRISELKSMMDRADIESSEKFRRVFEAYQVEVDYGRTIEAYTGLLQVDGVEREVEFLRIGRLDLIYITKDNQYAGIWDKKSNEFSALPSSATNQINKALRIAKKQLAPDMLTLPVQAAE